MYLKVMYYLEIDLLLKPVSFILAEYLIFEYNLNLLPVSYIFISK